MYPCTDHFNSRAAPKNAHPTSTTGKAQLREIFNLLHSTNLESSTLRQPHQI